MTQFRPVLFLFFIFFLTFSNYSFSEGFETIILDLYRLSQSEVLYKYSYLDPSQLLQISKMIEALEPKDQEVLLKKLAPLLKVRPRVDTRKFVAGFKGEAITRVVPFSNGEEMTSAVRENMDPLLFQRKWNASSMKRQKILVKEFLHLNPLFGVFVLSAKLLERNAVSFKSALIFPFSNQRADGPAPFQTQEDFIRALSEARANPELCGCFSRSFTVTRFDEIVRWIRVISPSQPKLIDDLNEVLQTRKKIGFVMKDSSPESQYEIQDGSAECIVLMRKMGL